MSNSTITIPPITIQAGKAKKSQIKKLKRGRGKLARQVDDTMEHIRTQWADKLDDGAVLVPVVLVYRKKEKSRSLTFPWLAS